MVAQVHVSYINIHNQFCKNKGNCLNGCAGARVLHQHPHQFCKYK